VSETGRKTREILSPPDLGRGIVRVGLSRKGLASGSFDAKEPCEGLL
jgi:hypothetical protein